MITTATPLVAADGAVLSFHAIVGRAVDLATGVVTLTVGSWVSEHQAQAQPHQKTELVVRYPNWSPEYYDQADAAVMSHPGWTGLGPEMPSPEHVWCPLDLVWLAPIAKPLNEVKAAMWAKVKQARAAAEYGGFTWDGSTFDSDPISQARITGAVTLAQTNPAFSIGWTLADNSVRTLSAADMIAVGVALGQHVNACHEKARVLRAEIEAAMTVEDVGAIAPKSY